jgi:hypothetical protein
MRTLGDAGVSNSDALYSGETGDSVFSVQYYRNKASEFQSVLNQVDATSRAAQAAIEAGTSPALSADLADMLSDYDSKKLLFRGTAEAINAGAEVFNALGGRFPQLSIPAGLGLAPLVIPAATVAAIGVAAGLIIWGSQWVAGVVQRMETEQLLGYGTPEQKADLARELARARSAQMLASESPLQSISGVVKWGAIALLGWMAWQAFQKSKFAR